MAELSPEVRAWMSSINKKTEIVVQASSIVIPRRYTFGDLELDVATGGGIPGNQWTEIVGPESAGKTLIVLKAIAANQRLDPEFTTFWVAAEPWNSEYAEMLGVDCERVVVSPASQKMELGLELLEFAAASKLFDFVVLDSYPALIPEEESEKAMDEATMAAGAKLFNKFWRKAGDASYRKYDGTERPFAGIVINQWRDKIGGNMPGRPPLQFSPGGHGKDYAFYMRLKVTHKEFLKEHRPGTGDVVVGKHFMVSTIKNKTTAPQQNADVNFYFRNAPFAGFRRGDYDLGREYVSLGKLFGVLGVSGSWLSYDGQKWGSKADMEAAVREDLGLQEKLRAEVLEIAADPRRQDDIAAHLAQEQTAPKVTRKRRSS